MKKTYKKRLNPQQRLFCQLYVSDREFFGNGVQAYAECYAKDLSKKGQYSVCAAAASRLLKNVNILAYINKLLEKLSLNDSFVDKQLAYLIAQHANLSCKLGAIKEYNRLKRRIIKKMELTGADGKPIEFNVTVKKTYKK